MRQLTLNNIKNLTLVLTLSMDIEDQIDVNGIPVVSGYTNGTKDHCLYVVGELVYYFENCDTSSQKLPFNWGTVLADILLHPLIGLKEIQELCYLITVSGYLPLYK